MWDLPRPGLEPVSPALAGRFSTTAPPGKPLFHFWWELYKIEFTKIPLFMRHKRVVILQTVSVSVWNYSFSTSKLPTTTPTFTAALFTIAKTWKQPKCPSTEEWLKKMCYIYTMEYYSAIKKRMKYCHSQQQGWTFEIIIISEVSQAEKDKYHIISIICGI